MTKHILRVYIHVIIQFPYGEPSHKYVIKDFSGFWIFKLRNIMEIQKKSY